jgi:hypothetical protein
MINVVLSGRTDIDDYFRISGVFDYEKLNHTPFLVFAETGDTLQIQIIDSVQKLLTFPDETPVMGQWRGDYHSDYFQFKVSQYRQFLESRDADLLKTVRRAVKYLGPLGGFRSFSYEYMSERGSIVSTSTGSKPEAERLEALFIKNGNSVEIKKEARNY